MSQKVKIAGLMAVADNPLSTCMAVKLSQIVDYLVIRYDIIRGHKENGEGGKFHYGLFSTLNPFSCPVDHFCATTGYSGGTFWREEMLRRLDSIEPELVFCFDVDEWPENEKQFLEEVNIFSKTNICYMMFHYKMISVDGRKVPQTPHAPHCKVWRWKPGLSMKDGSGFGKPNYKIYSPRKDEWAYMAKTKMLHYSMYTKELEKNKMLWYKKFKSPGALNKMISGGGIKKTIDEYYKSIE